MSIMKGETMDETQVKEGAADALEGMKTAAAGKVAAGTRAAKGKATAAARSARTKTRTGAKRVKQAAGEAAKAAQETGEALREQVDSAASARRPLRQFIETGSRVNAHVEEFFRQRPWLSLFGVALASYALAFATRRPPQPTMIEVAKKRLR